MKLYTLTYLGLLNDYLIVEYQGRDNIVVQAWKPNVIIMIETTT